MLNFLIHNLGNLYLTANIGDSPFISVDAEKGIVSEKTMELNCDSIEAWKLYAQDCIDKGITLKLPV